MTYVTPTPNTDPNNFGTVDVTLDPTMSDATIQTKIDQAGAGGIIEWAGSTHFQINTNLRFLSGQKHFTDNNRIIKLTNTSHLDHIVNLKSPKGGGPSSTDVTISDLEFWGHLNVPNKPTASAPRSIIVPWEGTFLRRVGIKGGEETGLRMDGDRRTDLGIRIDTCEIAYNVYTADSGTEGGAKFTTLGVCGTPAGDVMTIQCCEVHHNWAHGLWWDIGSAGVALHANNCHDNARCGIFWEVGSGPVYMRDNDCQNNGGGGDIPNNGGNTDGICVISSATGFIYNNTLGGNGGVGIRMFEDTSPASRTSLNCPSLAQPGQHQGYFWDAWEVVGNVLNGNGVSTDVTTTPEIHYDTATFVDGGGGGGGGDVAVTEPIAEVADSTNVTSYAIGPFTPPANSVLVVHVADTDLAGGAVTGATITDDGSHTWTQVSGSPFDNTATDLYRLQVFWTTIGASPAAMTITNATYSQNQNSNILAVLAFTNANTTTPIAQATTDTDASGTPNTSLPSAPAANSMVVWLGQIRRNPAGWTDEAGWTTHADTGGDVNGMHLASKLGDQTYTATGTNGTTWSIMYEVQGVATSPQSQTIGQVLETDTPLEVTPSIPKGLASPYTVEVDLTSPILDEPSIWTDLTPFVRGFDIRRGRQHELGTVQAGEASLTLDNRDRSFDPTNTASPYYPNIRPMRHMRIRATTDVRTYDLFTGFVEDWGQQWSGPNTAGMGDATCEVHLVDAFSVLNRTDITSYRAEVLADEPLAYWILDEPQGSGFVTSRGSNTLSLFDVSPTGAAEKLGRDGALPGGCTAWEVGAGAEWNSTAQADEVWKLKGDFTIEGWLFSEVGINGFIIFQTTAANIGGIQLTKNGNNLSLFNQENGYGINSTGTLTQDVWSHFAVTRSAGVATFYINGVAAGSFPYPQAATRGDVTVQIGDSTSTSETGELAHIAIWPTAVSAERIAIHAACEMDTLIAGQTVDAAIEHVLNAIDWPGSLRFLGASGHTVAEHDPDPNALTELQTLAVDTDGGAFFATGDGTLLFLSADDLRKDPAPLATWGDSSAELRYSGLTLRYDDEDLYPEVRATAEGLADAVATDLAGMDTYGPRTLDTSAGVLENQLQLNDRATGFLARYKDPHLRPDTLLALGSTTSTQAGRLDEMFASEIGRKVSVIRRPPGGGSLTVASVVEGVSHSSVEQMAQIQTTLNLAPTEATPWILGDSTYSVLGSTTILGW